VTEETSLRETPGGLEPEGDGWFVVNVRDTAWVTHARFGDGCVFESREAAPFPELGINISVLQPGQPVGLYHEEAAQEDFLVLAGEVLLLVDDEERALRAWDFVHSPAGTGHVLIGAGEGRSIVLAVGARHEPGRIRYPVSEAAARHGASVQAETDDPKEAYAPFEPTRPGRPASWPELPWS
jgi:uncharacterized cupin superfamily protein